MTNKKPKDAASPLSPKKEAILTVLYRFGVKGIYNLHLLDAIQQADESIGRKKTSLGTFYPTIKRLEEDGLIEGFWDDKELAPGVKRRYLRITGVGTKVLISNRQYRSILEGETALDWSHLTIQKEGDIV